MKKLIKLFVMGWIIFCFQYGTVFIYASSDITIDNNITTETNISRSNKIVWKYKYINGKLYKRKYNATTKKWIGEWVRA